MRKGFKLNWLTGSQGFVTPAYTQPHFFSVQVRGQDPISTINYFVHYSAQNNRGKDTFLESD